MSNDQDDDRTVIRPSGFQQSSSFPPTQHTPSASPPSVLPSMSGPATAASSAGDSGNALPIGTFLAEFELTAVLGEGGFGIVYQAWDHSLERKVALKEYMPSSLAARMAAATVQVKSERHRETFEMGRKSFINEAKLLAQFDHPALVKVYRFWEANGTAYMVMPLYEGITLKDHLKTLSSGPPDETFLLTMLDPLTAALAVIHRDQCFHRDIAPDNVILLGGNGSRPLLLDFGAARRVIGDMTQALTVILKPGYAPVEQYAEAPHMKQGAWTDVYALAASVHFCLLGKTPPPSVSRMMGDTYEPLETRLAGRYSARFLQAIDKALIVKPDERTQSIAELRADLGLAEGHQVAQTVMPTRIQSAPEAPRPAARSEDRNKPAAKSGGSSSKAPLIGLGVAAVVAAGIGGYFFMRPAPAPGPTSAQTAPSQEVSAAPAPAPATVPAAAAPAPHFDARQQFDTLVTQQTPGFRVTATAARNELRVGKDSLGFSVSSERAGYLNVLLLGPDGSLIQLFPNSKATDNRIAAGQTIKLPGASWPLEASEPLGAEHFLVVVSEKPRDYSMLSTERDYLFLKLPTGPRADAFVASWNRSTPLLLGAAPKDCQGPACDVYGAAVFSMEIVK